MTVNLADIIRRHQNAKPGPDKFSQSSGFEDSEGCVWWADENGNPHFPTIDFVKNAYSDIGALLETVRYFQTLSEANRVGWYIDEEDPIRRAILDNGCTCQVETAEVGWWWAVMGPTGDLVGSGVEGTQDAAVIAAYVAAQAA